MGRFLKWVFIILLVLVVLTGLAIWALLGGFMALLSWIAPML